MITKPALTMDDVDAMGAAATAEALAPDTAMPVDAPVVAEVSEDSEMEALFDSMNEEQDDQTP
ncbi:MAG: hypothetical protein ACO3QY_05235, partial [Burkholderiaceae bacterium]